LFEGEELYVGHQLTKPLDVLQMLSYWS